MKKIEVFELSEEAFSPFGSILQTEGRAFCGETGVYQWYEKQAQVDGAETVSINLLVTHMRPYVGERFEAHERTTETILPLTGGVIVAGMPAGEPDAEKLRAFYIPVGKGVSWARGAWHYAPYPIDGDATCAVVFRHGTGADDAVFANLPEPVVFQYEAGEPGGTKSRAGARKTKA
ncbi:MAG: ureidoglycolate lyase [Eubacteriales bacterium]|nr:ureidoglycolate lyase [Eubacteriales bacterium]